MATPIVRSTGETESEKYLSALAEKTFLNLWSYANLFIDKRSGANGDGKELCDLLVVCGDHVLVFSEKTIAFQTDKETPVAWQRWYRAAVLESVKQVNGATRWIKQFPNRIFLDRACTMPFPIALPSPDRARFHGIVVARGSKEACRKHFGGGTGSLMLKSGASEIFCIGDVNEGKDFIHVLDDVTLDVVLSELDTISDMTRYLEKKEKFIRSGALALAQGEEDLLAYYLISFSPLTNERDFLKEDGTPCKAGEQLAMKPGNYADLYAKPAFQAKKLEDRVSYTWDKLISQFTSPMLKAEMEETEERPYQFTESELVVRYMALEDRFQRRVRSKALGGLISQYKKGMARVCRAVLPSPTDGSNTGYVFLMLLRPEGDMGQEEFRNGQYKEYRKYRRAMLSAYCMYYANQNRHLERIVGIASEPPADVTGMPGSSEELLMVDIRDWTEEHAENAAEGAKLFNIGKPENLSQKRLGEDEFPRTDALPFQSDGFSMNRKQRRTLQGLERRRKR